MRHNPTAHGRATLAGSAVPASHPVGVAIAIGVAVAIENRTRRAITHLGSLQFRTDCDSDGDPDSDTDPDKPGPTPRSARHAEATPSSIGRLQIFGEACCHSGEGTPRCAEVLIADNNIMPLTSIMGGVIITPAWRVVRSEIAPMIAGDTASPST